MNMSTIIDKDVRASALKFARGVYQTSLLHGRARWSGADLRGKARHFGAHYKHSRENLVKRLARVFSVEFIHGRHGLKVLKISVKQGVTV